MTELQTTVVRKLLEAQFDGKDLPAPALIGPRGTGKTSSVKSLAKQLGAGLLNVSIPSKDLTYFTG